MKISHTDTNAVSGTHALLIDANYSGSDTFTGDMTNAGLYIDLDSSATGGGTSHEHRIYGVYSDVRHTGDTDICYSGYFHAQSDHTTGQCSALRGVYAQAVDSALGTNSSVVAGEFKALKDAGSTNTTATMMGIRSEVEVDAGIVTNAYAVHGHIDRDGGTITNGYLFHGSYAGTDTGVKWGLYLSGDEKNYVTGSFEAGGAILAGGNVTAYSDIRRKKDLVKLDNALNKVEQLTGYTYTNKIDNKRYTGLIAQDVQKVLPEAVQAEKLDGHLSLAYGNMAGLFVEAIKELVHKIEILEARLNVIENNK